MTNKKNAFSEFQWWAIKKAEWLILHSDSKRIFFELTPTSIQIQNFTKTHHTEILLGKNSLWQKKNNQSSYCSIAWEKASQIAYSDFPFPERKNSCSFYYQLSIRLKRLFYSQTSDPLQLLIFLKFALRSGKNAKSDPARLQTSLYITALQSIIQKLWTLAYWYLICIFLPESNEKLW